MNGAGGRGVIGEFVDVSVPGFTGQVHVRCDGPVGAPVLLLLHGFSGSMHWYGAVVGPLATRYREIRVDLLGHGATRGPAADAPLQARVIAAVLGRLEVRAVTAIGHSFGADVAVDLAEHSDRVDRVVIVCQAPDYTVARLPRWWELSARPVVGVFIWRLARAAALGLALGLRVVRPAAGHREVVDQVVHDFRMMNRRMFRVAVVQRRVRTASRPLDAQLRESGVPALAIVGGRDDFFGDRYADRYRAVGVKVVVLPDAGHSPVVERPDRIVELIGGFVPSAAGPPG